MVLRGTRARMLVAFIVVIPISGIVGAVGLTLVVVF